MNTVTKWQIIKQIRPVNWVSVDTEGTVSIFFRLVSVRELFGLHLIMSPHVYYHFWRIFVKFWYCWKETGTRDLAKLAIGQFVGARIAKAFVAKLAGLIGFSRAMAQLGKQANVLRLKGHLKWPYQLHICNLTDSFVFSVCIGSDINNWNRQFLSTRFAYI